VCIGKEYFIVQSKGRTIDLRDKDGESSWPINLYSDIRLCRLVPDDVDDLAKWQGFEDTIAELRSQLRKAQTRLVPDEGVSVQPICAKCNDYLEPPAYCETCYDTAINAWREAEAALTQRRAASGSVPMEVVEAIMALAAHQEVSGYSLTATRIRAWLQQQQKGGE